MGFSRVYLCSKKGFGTETPVTPINENGYDRGYMPTYLSCIFVNLFNIHCTKFPYNMGCSYALKTHCTKILYIMV